MDEQLVPITSAIHSGQTWFVSRHQGSIDWIKSQEIQVDRFCAHLADDNWPCSGDTVIGSLPVHVIAKLNLAGVRFLHFELNLSELTRGLELTRARIEQMEVRMQEYMVWRIDK
jgi:CRISPR-associated protein Csx16